jgi:hypothetical protein
MPNPDCEHNFQIFKRTWQTVDYARYQVLDHSIEAAVCTKCFKILNPFQGEADKDA